MQVWCGAARPHLDIDLAVCKALDLDLAQIGAQVRRHLCSQGLWRDTKERGAAAASAQSVPTIARRCSRGDRWLLLTQTHTLAVLDPSVARGSPSAQTQPCAHLVARAREDPQARRRRRHVPRRRHARHPQLFLPPRDVQHRPPWHKARPACGGGNRHAVCGCCFCGCERRSRRHRCRRAHLRGAKVGLLHREAGWSPHTWTHAACGEAQEGPFSNQFERAALRSRQPQPAAHSHQAHRRPWPRRGRGCDKKPSAEPWLMMMSCRQRKRGWREAGSAVSIGKKPCI